MRCIIWCLHYITQFATDAAYCDYVVSQKKKEPRHVQLLLRQLLFDFNNVLIAMLLRQSKGGLDDYAFHTTWQSVKTELHIFT